MAKFRTARDGKNYTREEFFFFYGEEKGERQWQAAQIPSVATEHAVRDGETYTRARFLERFGDESCEHQSQAAQVQNVATTSRVAKN